MHQPTKNLVATLFAFCFLIKILPFALLHLGMDIQSDGTYPWTFTPIFAVGIFGIALFRDVRVGFLIPVAAILLGDVAIGLLTGLKYGLSDGLAFMLYPSQTTNYLALLLACSMALVVRYQRNMTTVLVASVLAPVLFYVVSNFGVWAFDTWINYPKTMAGLQQAYVAGLPFLKNSLISTLTYSALLFSPLGLAQLRKHSVSTIASAATSPAPLNP